MSTREESYSGYPLWIVPLTGGDAPEPDGHPNAVRIYADENQDLRTIKSDGTDAPVGGGGAPTVLTTTTVLTDAQVKALPSTPAEIIPALGANKIILPIGALLGPRSGAAYTNVDPGTLGLSWGDGSEAWCDMVGGACLTSPYSDEMGSRASFNEHQTRTDGIIDTAIMLVCDNSGAGGDFTGGGDDNRLPITVIYGVIDLG